MRILEITMAVNIQEADDQRPFDAKEFDDENQAMISRVLEAIVPHPDSRIATNRAGEFVHAIVTDTRWREDVNPTRLQKAMADMVENRDKENEKPEVLHGRADLIQIADFLITAIRNDDDVRALIDKAIDSYFYSPEEIDAKMALKGEELRKEAALHLVQAFVNINTSKGR